MKFFSLLFCTCLLAGEPQLVPDLSFGVERGDDAYLWGHVGTHVSADAAGNMYVADIAGNRVLEFDAKGNFVKIFASKGSGPGQYTGLLRFVATDQGFVGLNKVDSALSRYEYGADGRLINTKNRSCILESAALSSDGQYVSGLWIANRQEDQLRHFISGVLGPDLQPVKQFSDISGPLPNRARFGDPAYWVAAIAENLTRVQKTAIVHADKAGRFYSAYRQDAKIQVSSLDKEIRSCQVQGKPRPQSSEEIEAYVSSLTEQVRSDPELGSILNGSVIRKAVAVADLAAVTPRIYALTTTDKGLILAVTDINLLTRATRATLFDEKGQSLGEWSLPDFGLAVMCEGVYQARISFRGDFAYTILTDEDGENRVQRYRFKP